jgi:hypothetical protein
MLVYPRRWLDESESSIALTGQGIGRIALTVKNHNARTSWNLWRRPIVGGPTWNAVVFKAGAPLRKPIRQLALTVQKV